MVFCEHCRILLPEGKEFCPKCGAPVTAAREAAAELPPQPDSPAKKPANKKLLFIIGGVELVAAIALVAFLILVNVDPARADWGRYHLGGAEMSGQEIEIAVLRASDFPIELKYIDLNCLGICSLNVDGSAAYGRWRADNGVVRVKGGGIDCYGTVKDGVLALDNVLDTGVTLFFFQEGCIVLPPQTEEEEAAADVQRPAASEVTLTGNWRGWVSVTKQWGTENTEDEYYNASAFINMSGSGRPYFDVHVDGVDDYLFASIWLAEDPEDKHFIPDLDDGGSWLWWCDIDGSYAAALDTSINSQGELYFPAFAFTVQSGEYGCTIEMCFSKV